MSPTEIAEQMGRNGFCVCPGFLSNEQVIETRTDFILRFERGDFQLAGVGQGDGHVVRNTVRRDEVRWLSDSSNATQASLIDRLEILKTAFNRNLYLGLETFEGHYAQYPKGGFYRRHLDSFRDSNDRAGTRMVSVVLYLNENWQAVDGGELRIYDENDSYVDVAPLGGTLVCFLSREREHEVLLSTAVRRSLTGWFTTRP